MYTAGQQIEWLYEPRGGYCMGWWVPATVVKVGPKRLTIDALRTNGSTKRVIVKAERVRTKKS